MIEDRAIYRYVLYDVDRAWLHLTDEERELHKKEFAQALDADDAEIYPYSTVGLRGDGQLLLWFVAWDPAALQRAQARINGTGLGRWLRESHSYLAMTRRSQYLKGHAHEGQEHSDRPGPKGGAYLFVYPMDKQRPWYRVPFEERRQMMGEHFKIGHRYPDVHIHTGYSFGIDDQEFVVAFEGGSLGRFLDLVEELRGSAASAYTARDVPVLTAANLPLEAILDQIDGQTADHANGLFR